MLTANAYIAAVETADGQSLESGVKSAITDFIVGCHNDGIWSAIKASCILAGARTLSGALVPLVGTAPTNLNFVSGDYNRETGIVGNGSTKYLRSNKIGAIQNNAHNAVYVNTAPTLTIARTFIGYTGIGTDRTLLDSNTNGSLGSWFQSNSVRSVSGQAQTLGLKGQSRDNSANYVIRSGGINNTMTLTSGVVDNSNHFVFWRSGTLYSNARLSFYSIGESLDLAALDTRVSTLMTDLAAAIP
jgi:hypothetical protein